MLIFRQWLVGGGSYSGTIFTSLLETQTTGSLGYLGRTIWVDTWDY
jgi:hypothetical protein